MTAGKLLWLAALACAALAVVGAGALLVDAPPILGVHPAHKPLKFAVSIGVFLASMAVLVPRLETSEPVRLGLAAVLVGTNAIELALIAAQAVRSRTSHYNVATSLDATLLLVMAGAAVVMACAVIAVAVLATIRPLGTDAAMALAWRVALWLFLLVAITGFTMVSHGRHTVGAPDGGAGLPVANWSRAHGDLRVAHFLALHALQALPLLALAAGDRPALVGAGCVVYVGLAIAAFAGALAGRALL